MHNVWRPVFLLPVLTGVLTACQGSGLDGPAYAPLTGGSGLCFEVNLGDGIQDAAEVSAAFDCLNQYGAFEPLSPLVHYALASDRTKAVLDALNGTLSTFDVPGAIEAAARLLRAPERPLDGLQAIYNEAYDDDLLNPLLAVVGEASVSMDTCELSASPADCSVLRLGRALLKTDLLDRAGRVLEALPEPDPTAAPHAGLTTLADLLLAMQAGRQPDGRNVLLSLGSFFLAPQPDGATPLRRLVDVAQPLLDDDALIEDLASELARLDREGLLDQLDDDVRVLFTHDLAGHDVGFDGDTIVKRLLDVLGSADPALLQEPITLPGASQPTTLLDTAFVLMDDLYAQDADIAAILEAVGDVTDLVCTSDASNDLCELVDTLLPPINALVEQTTVVPAIVLPLVHVLYANVDLDPILDVLPDVLAWDLLDRTEPLLRFSVERDLLAGLPDLLRVFIDSRLGRVRADGWDALELVRTLLRPLDVEGTEVVPLDVPLGLMGDLLDPDDREADLDRLTVIVAERMVSADSALSVDAISALFTDLGTALALEHIDLLAVVTDLLDNTDLWRAGLHLGADRDLLALLRPDQSDPALPPRDAPAWLRDLIARGLLDRILDWTAGLLGQLGDIGLIDVPPDPTATP